MRNRGSGAAIRLAGILVAILAGVLSGCATTEVERSGFRVRIENISSESELATPLSPGVWVIHDSEFRLFREDMPDSGSGLESLAEDGNPAALAASIAGNSMTSQTGVFNIPTDSETPTILAPGREAAYEFSFRAAPGDRLSFISMFVQSNDLFFAPQDRGIDLFPAGRPIDGDITTQIILWDAGVELNELPGGGENQPLRQAAANSGDDENGVVRRVADAYEYPPVASLIRVMISAE